MKPKVSVTMPVLNGERYIAEAIQSILDQTYKNCELVVIDDGSTDGTCGQIKPFLEKMEIKYIRHEQRRGIAPSMNNGVRNSSGDFIAFLDHDDAWLPEFLETQVNHLLGHPDVGMVHSDFQTIDPEGKVLEASIAAWRGKTRPSGYVFRELFMDSFIVGNSVLIRKECFERLGLFDESLRWGDYHMWMRIARHYKVDYVGKALTQYRQHPTQSTRTVDVSRPEEESVGIQAIQKILGSYPEVRQELGEAVIRRRLSSLYFDLAYSWFSRGVPRNARICLAKAIRYSPASGKYYLLYAASFLKPQHTDVLRKAWRHVREAVSPTERPREAADKIGSATGRSIP